MQNAELIDLFNGNDQCHLPNYGDIKAFGATGAFIKNKMLVCGGGVTNGYHMYVHLAYFEKFFQSFLKITRNFLYAHFMKVHKIFLKIT